MSELGRLTRLKVEGFKSIRSMDLEMRDLNILIGANGAGKSNLISFFKFMSKFVDDDLKSYVRQQGGVDRFMHFGRKVTDAILISMDFDVGSFSSLFVSDVFGNMAFSLFDGNSIRSHELIRFLKDDAVRSGKFIGSEDATHLDLMKLYDFELMVRSFLRRFDSGVYHFHDVGEVSVIKRDCRTADTDRLRPDGANLAAFLRFIQTCHPRNYDDIVATVRRVAPFFRDFILKPNPENPEYIRLKWKHEGTDDYFDVHDLSDGTLRFICLATLLLQPNPPSLIILDEPELGLHPYAVELLAGMMQSAAARTQVIAATQSVTLANQFDWQDLIIVDRVDNASEFRRLKESEVEDWLEHYRMGDIWQKDLIGGTP